MKLSIKYLTAFLVVSAFATLSLLPVVPASAQEPTVTRKILMQTDAPTPGYEALLISVVIPPGGREGRHTHPGLAMVYVQQGTLTLDYEGKPTATYKAGDTFYVEPGKIHEGQNHGKTPVKVLGSFIVKKGEPLTTQVH